MPRSIPKTLTHDPKPTKKTVRAASHRLCCWHPGMQSAASGRGRRAHMMSNSASLYGGAHLFFDTCRIQHSSLLALLFHDV